LAKLAFSAETLEQAIQEILKFLSLVLDDIQGELIQQGAKAYLICMTVNILNECLLIRPI
jgi:hypothetical protein